MSWVEVDGQMLWQCPAWAGRIRWATLEGDLLLVETGGVTAAEAEAVAADLNAQAAALEAAIAPPPAPPAA